MSTQERDLQRKRGGGGGNKERKIKGERGREKEFQTEKNRKDALRGRGSLKEKQASLGETQTLNREGWDSLHTTVPLNLLRNKLTSVFYIKALNMVLHSLMQYQDIIHFLPEKWLAFLLCSHPKKLLHPVPYG